MLKLFYVLVLDIFVLKEIVDIVYMVECFD